MARPRCRAIVSLDHWMRSRVVFVRVLVGFYRGVCVTGVGGGAVVEVVAEGGGGDVGGGSGFGVGGPVADSEFPGEEDSVTGGEGAVGVFGEVAVAGDGVPVGGGVGPCLGGGVVVVGGVGEAEGGDVESVAGSDAAGRGGNNSGDRDGGFHELLFLLVWLGVRSSSWWLLSGKWSDTALVGEWAMVRGIPDTAKRWRICRESR